VATAALLAMVLASPSVAVVVESAPPITFAGSPNDLWAEVASLQEGVDLADEWFRFSLADTVDLDALTVLYFEMILRPTLLPVSVAGFDRYLTYLHMSSRVATDRGGAPAGETPDLPTDKHSGSIVRERSALLAMPARFPGTNSYKLDGDRRSIDYGMGSPGQRLAGPRPVRAANSSTSSGRFDYSTTSVVSSVGAAPASPPMVGTLPGDDEEIHWIVFEATSGNLSAEVRFWQEGNKLMIQLINTSLVDPVDGAGVLTALFFNVDGQPTLAPVSAVIASGSRLLYPIRQPSDGVSVGGEWAYRAGDVKSPGSMEYGLSATGFNAIFKPADRFPGESLINNGNSMSDISFGLVGPGKVLDGKDKAMYASNPFIQTSIIFTLTGLPETFDLMYDITNVWFQYGTSLNNPYLTSTRIIQRWEEEIINPPDPPVVPEPATLSLLAAGAMGLLRRRR